MVIGGNTITFLDTNTCTKAKVPSKGGGVPILPESTSSETPKLDDDLVEITSQSDAPPVAAARNGDDSTIDLRKFSSNEPNHETSLSANIDEGGSKFMTSASTTESSDDRGPNQLGTSTRLDTRNCDEQNSRTEQQTLERQQIRPMHGESRHNNIASLSAAVVNGKKVLLVETLPEDDLQARVEEPATPNEMPRKEGATSQRNGIF